MTYKNFFPLFCLALLLAFFACDKSSPNGNDPLAYDKTGMLSNYADNLIIPQYQLLQQKLTALQSAAEQFFAAPSTSTQTDLKLAYRAAHLQYERVAAFQFGPAETLLLDVFANYSGGLDYDFNTAGELTGFSIDTVTIESHITSGVYDLSKVTRNVLYAQGFPALNYLYFEPKAVARFSTNAGNRIQYTRDVLTRLQTLVNTATGDWATYRVTFVGNTQSNVGSPIGNMVNQLAYQVDLLKGPRIGWPFGKQSNGQVFAGKCEAYYAGISVALAVENLSALKDLYTGKTGGKGLSNYVVALNHSTLNDEVLAQFDLSLAALQQIPDPLSNSLSAEVAKVEAAYKEIQKLLTLLKTDVASATGVQITFTDNDGD